MSHTYAGVGLHFTFEFWFKKKRKGETKPSFHSVCHVEACHLEYLMDTFPEKNFINQAWSDTRLETKNS